MALGPLANSPAPLLLAGDLRRSVSRFVHAVRQRTDSARTAQSETLALLEREGAFNVATLAAKRKVTHQTMRVVVAQLTEQGLVERRPDPADARSRLIALSPRGRRAVEDDRLGRAQGIGALIEGALSDEQRRTLQAAIVVLDRLSEAAEE